MAECHDKIFEAACEHNDLAIRLKDSEESKDIQIYWIDAGR